MNTLLDKYIEDKVKEMSLKDLITGFLVRKKRRGTFQALEESTSIENEIVKNVIAYMDGWLTNEFMNGTLKEKLSTEVRTAVYMELARSGYEDILKNKK